MDQPAQTSPQGPAPLPQQPSVPAPAAPSQAKGLAITALVLGIIAFLFGWLGFLNLPVAIAAVVFGSIALIKRQPKGLAVTGTVLGGIGLLFSLLWAVFFSAAILGGIQERANEVANGTSSSSSTTWKVSEAYDKVTTGMTKAEVEAAISKTAVNCSVSDDTYGKYETCTYGNFITDGGSVTVSYTDDKVTSKSKFGDE